MSSSAFQPSHTLSWKKGAALLDQLSAKKEQSAPMVDYLFDKVNLAENLRKLSFNLSEQDLKEHIFKGLPQHYVQFFDEWRMDSLTVVGNKLIAEEMKLNQANGGSMVNPLRGRRPEKESYRGDVMVLMTLVITLLFQVAAKSSDDVFSPLKDLSSCDCHGSGPTWACDCTPHAFVIYHVLLAFGFSVSVLSLMRIIFLIQHCFWLLSGIIGVVLAFAWTVYSATPTEYRLLVLVIDVMAFVGIGTLMLLVAHYQIHWVSLKILKKAASLVWTALQYGIVAIWTLTQFVFGQGWHACKTCGTSLKHLWDEAFIRAPPPDDAAPYKTTKKKITSAFIFPGVLDMRQRLSEPSQVASIYDLSAVLIHKGTAVNSGHYVAHIKDGKTGQWWEFDNEHVSNLGSHPFGEGTSRSNSKPVKPEPAS